MSHRHFYTQTFLRTNALTQKHFYTQTSLHTLTEAFIHRFQSHTHAFTHTCSELSLRILLWSAPDVQKQSSYTWQEQEGVWCELKGKFFRRHLEEWNNINRSQEELRNISRKLEWTRDSPQSQIAPTVQKDTWEVTFIRSCAEFKNPVVILVEKRHGGFWVGHAPSRFKNCRYVCTATWMGLRWPMPSKCPWAPCET